MHHMHRISSSSSSSTAQNWSYKAAGQTMLLLLLLLLLAHPELVIACAYNSYLLLRTYLTIAANQL